MAVTSRSVRLDIRGEKKLVRTIERLDKRVRRKVVGKALTKASKPIVRHAKGRVNDRTGLLRLSIGTKKKSYRQGQAIIVVIGPRKNYSAGKVAKIRAAGGAAAKAEPAFYAHLVHDGTKPHEIRSVSMGGDGFRSTKEGGPTTSHPGSKANPFLADAMKAKASSARGILIRELRAGIRRAAKG